MKKTIGILALVLFAFLFSGCQNADDKLLPYPTNTNEVLSPKIDTGSTITNELFANNLCVVPVNAKLPTDDKLTALSTLIFDITDQEILYANNIYQKIYPASITKIMTALVTLKYADLNDTVTVSKNAANITESGAKLCGFNEGDQIKLEDLLRVFLIYSGNDAGIAIAEHVGGSASEFSDMMNKEAIALGAVDSHFVNSHGLHDDNHYTTAYDIYLIFNELTNYKTFIDIINTNVVNIEYKSVDGETLQKSYETTNRYLNGKMEAPKGVKVIGGKTGTTSKAGSCLVLYSEDKKKHSYVSIVLKAQSGDDLFYQMSYLLGMIQ